MMGEFKFPENCLDCTYFQDEGTDSLGTWAAHCTIHSGHGIDPKCPDKKTRKSKELRREG